MKYVNGKELLMFLEPPITRLSVFEAETIDAALIMCAEAFKKIEEQCKVTIDFPTFKFQLLKTMSEFLAAYKQEHEDYLKQPQLPCIEADSRNWIISLTDGRVFKNSKEACLLYGIDASRISMQLNGVKPTAGTDCLGRKLIFQRFEDFRKEQLNEG